MKIFFPFLFLLSAYNLSSQQIIIDIYLFGGKIGQSVVQRTVKNDSVTEYKLNSSSEAHVFFTTRKITLLYEEVYKYGHLLSSYCRHTRNDELQITTIARRGNGYVVNANNGISLINELVDCATVKLFFDEPCSMNKVLSERLGEYRTFKKTGEGVYEAEMKEGLTYTYRYKQGKLVELEMRKGIIGSVYLRLRESK